MIPLLEASRRVFFTLVPWCIDPRAILGRKRKKEKKKKLSRKLGNSATPTLHVPAVPTRCRCQTGSSGVEKHARRWVRTRWAFPPQCCSSQTLHSHLRTVSTRQARMPVRAHVRADMRGECGVTAMKLQPRCLNQPPQPLRLPVALRSSACVEQQQTSLSPPPRPSMNVKEREESFIEQQVSDLHTVSTQCRETSGCAPRRPALPAETQRGEGAAPVPVSYRLLARARNRCLGGRMMRECKRKNKACGRSRPSPSPASRPVLRALPRDAR